MTGDIYDILDKTHFVFDKNGIFVKKGKVVSVDKLTEETWNRIYSFQDEDLVRDRDDFDKTKLFDTSKQLENTYRFSDKTVYLEIGSGPSHIGEYILKRYKGYFVGVDTNYSILVTVKKYLESKGYKKFVLIHSDIRKMPIKDGVVDFIYGGGVIEHFPDIKSVMAESVRVTKKGGVIYNTVPAFNFWWLLRFWSNIPYKQPFRNLFYWIHYRIFGGRILEKYFGYELSFTCRELRDLYYDSGLAKIKTGPFRFRASLIRVTSKIIRDIFYATQSSHLTAAVLFVSGKKK